MLLKMYRYDMKNVSMPLLIVHGVLLLLAVAAMILVPIGSGVNTPDAIRAAETIVMILLVLTAITAVVMTNLLLIIRFYKRMFTEEGYLTNALPMSADQLLLSHTLAYLTWFAVDVLLVMGSFLVLLIRTDGSAGASSAELVPYITFLILTVILGILAASCCMSGLAHLAGSVGHLFPENKGLMTFIFYLIFGFACQVIYAVLSVCLLLAYRGTTFLSYESFHGADGKLVNIYAAGGPIVLILFFGLMALAAVMYFISRTIIKNHLNLA